MAAEGDEEDEEGGGRGVVVSAVLLLFVSVSVQGGAADSTGGCRFLPPPSLQLDTSDNDTQHQHITSRLIQASGFTSQLKP